jgi:hypothetical protein
LLENNMQRETVHRMVHQLESGCWR